MPQFPAEVEAPLIVTSSLGYCVFSLLITIFHTVSVYNHRGKDVFTLKFIKRNPTMLLSYLLLIAGVMFGINSGLGALFGFYGTRYCYIQTHVGPSSYVLFKLFMYLTLVSRTWQIFRDSILKYDSKKLIIYALILILWSLTNMILNSLTVKLKQQDIYPRCLVTVSKPFLISVILLDFLGGIVNIILFITPLIKLSRDSAGSFDPEIKNLAKKQTILAIIAVISTIFSMIFVGAFGAPKLWATTDAVISTLCIILMHEWHSEFVTKLLCCCCIYRSQANKQKKVIKNMSLEIISDTHGSQIDKKEETETVTNAEK